MAGDIGKILSIQVGRVQQLRLPEAVQVDDPCWTSAIFKDPVFGPVRVGTYVIEGDEQADPDNHGGLDNVVLAYDGDHYPMWRTRLNLPELGPGGFGENFTVTGFTDHEVCIGDVWEVGGAEGLMLQVTQARQPCFKLARRLLRQEIVKMVVESSWGGWYLRVLREGIAEAGMEIRRTERRHPEWTVARAVQTMYARKRDPSTAQMLAALPELSRRWKEELVEG